MLTSYKYSELNDQQITKLVERNVDEDNSIRNKVEEIIQEVRENGDNALKIFAEKFDRVKLDSLSLNKVQIAELAANVEKEQQQALQTAFNNIRKFHLSQLVKEEKIETMPGVNCWREHRAIEKVGLYIPGGTAVLPSTFLMLGIPARIAGCKEIVVCSPPQSDGSINHYIAYCAVLLEIDHIFLAGGSQAVAAMAYGTESIPKVDKIFGPGNQFVTKAKTLIQSSTQTAIDMPAGPSEVLVIADENANPGFVAADLLAQAEHGKDSQAVLVTTSGTLLEQVIINLNGQLNLLPRKEIATKAIENSYAVLVSDLNEAIKFSNKYAPEHLILQTASWEDLIPRISNAGSVFLGDLTPESAGDYASGTNHTLPTSAYARSYSGVSVDSFVKKITFQHISEQGIKNIGPVVETLASLEGLQAHKNAVSIRLKTV
ncbi:histidinol dehydrogenase [Rubrolithibacter danxiaensis]|uniref:histidinol dehydrogenase n=1 Tax=Rubrolithibacter danxiaensis TaxID=3390805 RepID=UPI003BF8C15B